MGEREASVRIPAFLAIVGDLHGEGECGLLHHSQIACDLHVIAGRELLPVHSANGEMALPVLLALIERVNKFYNPYPGSRLAEREETIKTCLWRAKDALCDAIAACENVGIKCRCGHAELAHHPDRFDSRRGCGFIGCGCESFVRAEPAEVENTGAQPNG